MLQLKMQNTNMTYVEKWDDFVSLRDKILNKYGSCTVILFCSGKHCPPCNATKNALNIGKIDDFFQKMITDSKNEKIIFYCLDLQTQEPPIELYEVISGVRTIPHFLGLKVNKEKKYEIIANKVGGMNETTAKEFFDSINK